MPCTLLGSLRAVACERCYRGRVDLVGQGSPLPAVSLTRTAARAEWGALPESPSFRNKKGRDYNICELAWDDGRRGSSLPTVCLQTRRPILIG